jgi:hypothetical protein
MINLINDYNSSSSFYSILCVLILLPYWYKMAATACAERVLDREPEDLSSDVHISGKDSFSESITGYTFPWIFLEGNYAHHYTNTALHGYS